jgi:hypothetical protein
LEISVEEDRVILQKRQDICSFCGAESPRISYRDKRVCEDCANELGQLGRGEVKLTESS